MKTIENYNAIVPTMNRLAKEGYDLWPFHNSMQGFGFKLIRDKDWVETIVFEDAYVIRKHERNGNVFCSYTCKELGKAETQDYKEVYNLVKGLIK